MLLVTKAYRAVYLEALLLLARAQLIEYIARVRQALYLWKGGVSDIDLFGRSFFRNDMYEPRGYTVNLWSLVSIASDKFPSTGK